MGRLSKGSLTVSGAEFVGQLVGVLLGEAPAVDDATS